MVEYCIMRRCTQVERCSMPHSPEEKKQALTRIRRIKGQVATLEQALDAGAECPAILQQLAAVRGAVNGWMATVLESYLREEFPSRSEEHTSELQSLMRISYAVFCLKKKK